MHVIHADWYLFIVAKSDLKFGSFWLPGRQSSRALVVPPIGPSCVTPWWHCIIFCMTTWWQYVTTWWQCMIAWWRCDRVWLCVHVWPHVDMMKVCDHVRAAVRVWSYTDMMTSWQCVTAWWRYDHMLTVWRRACVCDHMLTWWKSVTTWCVHVWSLTDMLWPHVAIWHDDSVWPHDDGVTTCWHDDSVWPHDDGVTTCWRDDSVWPHDDGVTTCWHDDSVWPHDDGVTTCWRDDSVWPHDDSVTTCWHDDSVWPHDDGVTACVRADSRPVCPRLYQDEDGGSLLDRSSGWRAGAATPDPQQRQAPHARQLAETARSTGAGEGQRLHSPSRFLIIGIIWLGIDIIIVYYESILCVWNKHILCYLIYILYAYYEYAYLRQTFGAYKFNIPNTGNLYKI